MAAHPPPRQQQLARLFIPSGMNAQQPMAFAENPALFSPALPTSIQQGMHPPFPMQMQPPPSMHPMHPLQTPMQQTFFPQPPNAPGRPTMHRAHPSMAQLAAAGILPPPNLLGPPGIPMTPLGQSGFPPHMLSMPFQPFVPKSRRTQSVSTGGPPKAVLGGPQRKVSPMPAAIAPSPSPAPAPASAPVKSKKIIVSLPKETVKDEEEGTLSRPQWARTPLVVDVDMGDIWYPELASAEAYPPDTWRYHLPPTVDVFLPGKAAWDSMKQRIIEEKLVRLGVERGTGSGTSTVPHIHAPHARAASISSPADPALLMFKLSKLQQSQANSASPSLSTSPQPPMLAVSPANAGLLPRMQPRHGHSMSLAQPPSFQTSSSPVYNPTAAFNPFGPSATLGSDQIFPPPRRASPDPRTDAIAAPQGRVPMNIATLAPPQVALRPESRPDFSRGFGLDIPEEEEPEEDVAQREDSQTDIVEGNSREEQAEREGGAETDVDEDEVSTVAQSRIHSRHVSRLSAALSLVSVGRMDDPVMLGEPPVEELEVPVQSELDVPMDMPAPMTMPVAVAEVDGTDADAVEEWTGSEGFGTGSDDESIGEWSNPSDEERARKNRLHRRTVRRAAQLKRDLEIPRRLPNFPRPPDSGPSYLSSSNIDDDDVISNPSEEERLKARDSYLELDPLEHERFSRPGSAVSGQGRPLPPLPHSRAGSAQFSYHDPALAHSRDSSEHYSQPGGLRPPPAPIFTPAAVAAPTPRKDSLTLNPFAKPFVFGASSFTPASTSHTPPSAPASRSSLVHSRAPSFGKPLNAAAQEFKPGGFTFKAPPGVPKLTFAPPVAGPPTSRPLPVPPKLPSPVRAVQGREKRQRRASDASGSLADTSEDGNEDQDQDQEGQDTMHSFKFPLGVSDAVAFTRHSAPASPPDSAGLALEGGSASTKPFTFSGFSAAAATFGKQQDENEVQYALSDSALDKNLGQPLAESSPARGQQSSATELPFPPSSSKTRRAPIPLDFKHPVSTNTVPAGLFKNLNNGDSEERTRRTVRSRLSSRDIFEHSPRPSLDDINVPPISQRISRNRLFTDPGFRDASPEPMDVFSSSRRRSSMPTRHSADSSLSDMSVAPMNLSRRVEMQQYEQRLEQLLDEKVEGIKEALQEYRQASGGQTLSTSTEAMISEVVSLFRTQLNESAVKNLEDSQADARGELDFEVLKGLIEQGHTETRTFLQRELAALLASRDNTGSIKNLVQELSDRTLNHVATATTQLTHHIRSLDTSAESSSSEREAIVLDVIAGLTPHLAAMRTEPIDYEGLTMQLTQAVKPHISQLIDLASDKRETATLIVNQLIPILPTLQSPQPAFDTEDVVGRLVSEVRKVVAPLDTHEIKEQVSDLVVERLDSRLAVRDKAFNVDVVTEKVTESVSSLLAPVQELKVAVEVLSKASSEPAPAPEFDLSALRQGVLDLLSDLPDRLAAATEALGGARSDFKSQQDRFAEEDPRIAAFQQIDVKLNQFADEQEKLLNQNNELSDFCQDIVKHINSLPEAMLEATKVLQNAHADILERDTSAKDSDEIRRLLSTNSELSSQLAKARGAHGQVRVEKDMLGDRLRTAEAERDRMRVQVEQMQETVTTKSADAAAMEARNHELEEALAQALERIKSSDVTAQMNLERISNLEKTVQNLGDEKYQLKAKADSLEIKVAYAVREKESLAEDLVSLKKQQDETIQQQSQWDELRRTNENLQALTTLIAQNENEEVKELRRTRDKFRQLETEHSSVQRRLKDQENKVINNERSAQTVRQSLNQAQQRAIEWEKRAKDNEHELESTRSRLDQAEQSQAQLDADYSLVKLQLEERDAEERLANDRESKLRDQIAALEESVARLRAETDQAKKTAAAASSSAASAVSKRPIVSSRLRQNGFAPPTRPDSRASTVFGDSRVTTPTPPANGTHAAPGIRPSSPQQPSVWDSVHAPRNGRNVYRIPTTPKAKKPPHYPRSPSPAPSNVSAAPTLGDDGWWS